MLVIYFADSSFDEPSIVICTWNILWHIVLTSKDFSSCEVMLVPGFLIMAFTVHG